MNWIIIFLKNEESDLGKGSARGGAETRPNSNPSYTLLSLGHVSQNTQVGASSSRD